MWYKIIIRETKRAATMLTASTTKICSTVPRVHCFIFGKKVLPVIDNFYYFLLPYLYTGIISVVCWGGGGGGGGNL